MRPQVGKRAQNMVETPKQPLKTKARQFVESKLKYNMATKEDYLTMRNVASAINMNALEQRIIAKEKILNMISKGITLEQLVEVLENENQLDRHRLVKNYGF